MEREKYFMRNSQHGPPRREEESPAVVEGQKNGLLQGRAVQTQRPENAVGHALLQTEWGQICGCKEREEQSSTMDKAEVAHIE
jgi:hypothetical protein